MLEERLLSRRASVTGGLLLDGAVQARTAATAPSDAVVVRLRTCATYAGVAVAVIGVVVLVGWLTGVERLTTLTSTTINVKPNSALGLLGTGLGVAIAGAALRRGELGPLATRLITVLGVAVGLLMLLTLAEYAFELDFGLDDPFGVDDQVIGTPYPGRVPLVGALSFLLIALALVAMCVRYVRVAQQLALLALLGGSAGLIGYVFQVRALYDPVFGNTVSLPSALGVVLAALGVLALRPEQAYVSLLVGETAGGVVARRLMPWVILVPVALGSVASRLVDDGGAAPNVAISALVTLLVAAGASVVWVQASRLRFLDLRRSGAEDALVIAQRALRERDEMAARLVAQERYLRRIVATSVDAYVAIDEAGRVNAWNQAATDMFGWTLNQAIGARLEDLIIPEESVAGHQAGLRRYAATGKGTMLGQVVELEARHREGHLFPVELSVWAVTDDMTPSVDTAGHGLGFHAFIRDITGRKSTEAQLQAANEDLETFATIAAHDLRSPLTVIRGFAELVLPEVIGTPSPDQVVESARRIIAAADRGVALIDDLLGYALSGRQQRPFEVVDLDELTRQVAGEQMRIYGRSGAVSVEPLPDVVGDEELLRQLVANLIGNALKYADPARPPRVCVSGRLEVTESRGVEEVVLEVSDNGLPIPQADRERVFRAFERGVHPDAQGSGIGLAICTRVAELHGGSITLRTGAGGNTFEVRLPATYRD